jgi:hypothetical protein
MNKTVPELLREGAKTYEERNAIYGDNYKHWGHAMAAMFPNGLTLKTADEWNRFGVFVQIASKLTRYAESMTRGGHIDSAHDMCVYSAMLEELTRAEEGKHPGAVSVGETPMKLGFGSLRGAERLGEFLLAARRVVELILARPVGASGALPIGLREEAETVADFLRGEGMEVKPGRSS